LIRVSPTARSRVQCSIRRDRSARMPNRRRRPAWCRRSHLRENSSSAPAGRAGHLSILPIGSARTRFGSPYGPLRSAAPRRCHPRPEAEPTKVSAARSRENHRCCTVNKVGFYPSTAEANEATAPQIAAHSPSDNSTITISDAPGLNGRSVAPANRSDRDGLAVMASLRPRARCSATGASRCRFRATGLAGERPTAHRSMKFFPFLVIALRTCALTRTVMGHHRSTQAL
jgi:hypothetical protein